MLVSERFITFFFFNFQFPLCVCVYGWLFDLILCMSAHHVHTVPEEARRSCVFWNWSHRGLGVIMWDLGIEPRSSEKRQCPQHLSHPSSPVLGVVVVLVLWGLLYCFVFLTQKSLVAPKLFKCLRIDLNSCCSRLHLQCAGITSIGHHPRRGHLRFLKTVLSQNPVSYQQGLELQTLSASQDPSLDPSPESPGSGIHPNTSCPRRAV